MPLYEYVCNKCGEKFETRHSFWYDKKELKCPRCGAENPDRVYTPFSRESCSSDYSIGGG